MEGCPAEHVLEQYALDRLDGEARVEVERHVAGCGDCPARLVKLEREAQWLLAVLDAGTGESDTPCPDAEQLGRYAAGALTGQAREAVELHVADCRVCQAEIVGLYREVRAIDEGGEVAPVSSLEVKRAEREAALPEEREDGVRGRMPVGGLVSAVVFCVVGMAALTGVESRILDYPTVLTVTGALALAGFVLDRSRIGGVGVSGALALGGALLYLHGSVAGFTPWHRAVIVALFTATMVFARGGRQPKSLAQPLEEAKRSALDGEAAEETEVETPSTRQAGL